MWVDAQLSPEVAGWMTSRFGVPATPLRDLGLGSAKDREIFERARLADAVVLTKDADFAELLRRRGPPPRVLWLTAGNTSSARVCELLERLWPWVERELRRGEILVELTDRK